MEYTSLIQLVGFDIIFLGLVTLLVCFVGRNLWKKSTRSSQFIGAFKGGWDEYKSYLRGEVESNGDDSVSRPAKTAQWIGILLMAALLGMVINIVGDRLLDSDVIVRNIPVPSLWLDIKKDDKKWWELGKKDKEWWARDNWWPCKTWIPEDAIKTDALRAVSDIYPGSEKKRFRKAHLIGKKPQCLEWREEDYGDSEDHAKELFQRAYASILKQNNEPMLSVLRYEFLVIKVLRALFAASIALLLVALGGPWRRSLWWRLRKDRKNALKAAPGDRGKAVAGFIFMFALPLLFLSLWSMQSRRYDKKVFHYYMVIAGGDDPLLTPTPTPPPSPATTPSPSPTTTPSPSPATTPSPSPSTTPLPATSPSPPQPSG